MAWQVYQAFFWHVQIASQVHYAFHQNCAHQRLAGPVRLLSVLTYILRLSPDQSLFSQFCSDCIEIGIKRIAIWICMLLRQMPWKVDIFHIQNAIKTTFLNRVTWNLPHTFFRSYSNISVPIFRFFESLETWDFVFAKTNKKCWYNLQITKISKSSKIRGSSFVANYFPSISVFSDYFYL